MSYLEKSGQLTPVWRMKCEAALNASYQRLMTFEVGGGGFDWYGRAPAKTILTAYGIMELADMNRVYPIDTGVIDRAKKLLDGRQGADGAWPLDVPMHTWSRLSDSSLPVTAYVVWALREAGYEDEPVRRGMEYLRARESEAADPYVRALVALAIGRGYDVKRLEEGALIEGDAAFWATSGEGLCHSRGDAAVVETTALTAIALSRGGSPMASKALTWLTRARGMDGTWGTTQGTILALKALLEGAGPTPSDVPVGIRLRVNGKEIVGAFQKLSRDNFDVVQQAEIPVRPGQNEIELESDALYRISYQIAGRYYLPWAIAPRPESSPLSIEVAYDRTDLELTDTLRCIATLAYRGKETFMVIADLGIPPGFTPDTDVFERLVSDRTIDKYSMTGRQITLYFGKVVPGRMIRIEYALRPRFPIFAQDPRSAAYEYYTPQNQAFGVPRKIRVRPGK